MADIEIRIRKGEPIDKALRKLKKKLDREGTIKNVLKRRFFEKPSDKRRHMERRSKGR